MKIKTNNVYRFIPKDWSEFANSCRENTFIVKGKEKGKWIFEDTYWGINRYENKRYDLKWIKENGKLKYQFNLDDVEPISKEKCDYYNKKDTFVITDQHACVPSCIHYFLRKGAVKNAQVMIGVLKEKIRVAERDIRWAKEHIERDLESIKQIEAGNLDIYI